VASDRLLYTDSSALVKLIVEEPESAALRDLIAGRTLTASELVLAEVPRAIRRLVTNNRLPEERFVGAFDAVLGAVALVPIRSDILRQAGAFDAGFLRTLDAIHLAAALDLADGIDGFVSYDERQLEAAQLAGLPVLSPR
jgi:predicted nucleic acid-binding protein